MNFRLATPADSEALLKIYAQYIDTSITFEYKLPTNAEFTERIKDIVSVYPYVLCEFEGEIVGYAYAHRHLQRQAYQWNAQLSVYIDKNHHSKGVGKGLCLAVIELLRLQGVKTLYSLITQPNPSSERLHSVLGFTLIGTYHNTGYKNGRWRDVCIYEKALGEYNLAPKPITAITQLDKTLVNGVLARFCPS